MLSSKSALCMKRTEMMDYHKYGRGGRRGGGGCGDFIAREEFGERFDELMPACAFYLLFEVEINTARFNSYLGKDQSTVAHRRETNVDERSLKSCA